MQQTMEILSKLFGISIVRYFVIAGIPFLIFYFFLNNYFQKNKIQGREATKRDFIREIMHSLQTTGVLAVIAYFILYTPFRNYTKVYMELDSHATWWLPVSVILCLVIHDTYFYWMHRLLHHRAIFKLTHLLHHKSTNPSPWASYSFHFIEAWTEGAVLFVIVFLIPVHPLAVLAFTVAGFVINVYGHLGYEIVPRGFRKTIFFEFFNTSVYHNLHHSRFKGNYGLYFRVWDRLMGTEHPDYVKEFDRVQDQRSSEQSVRV